MRHIFYDTTEYRRLQSRKTKSAWQRGIHNSKRLPLEERRCKRKNCLNIFRIKPYDVKEFCSQSCSAIYNNIKRGSLTNEWRKNIARSMTGISNQSKGKHLVPRLEKICPGCHAVFLTERWKNNKHCSNLCSIRIIGSRPTSPKAARAISGIRPDIDSDIYFFSRWEANFARLLNLLKIKWIFQPKTFILKSQKYTPDFYLPKYKTYVEIKNFLSDYSHKRDQEFRFLYPKIKLSLILKKDYLELQERFSSFVKKWEFS